jgi:hypothetical protein
VRALNVNDTVYFLDKGFWEEAQVFMFGGDNQVLLDIGGTWLLKNVDEVKLGKDMTNDNWQNYRY